MIELRHDAQAQIIGCGQDGEGATCATGEGQNCGCGNQTVTSKAISIKPIGVIPTSRWTQIRSGALLGVACLTSPCCTPLYVPLVMAVLGGTPLAVWMGANLGWVYGGLTLVSVVSVVMAWRRWQKQS